VTPSFPAAPSLRVACIADTHLLVPDVKSAALFPRRLRAMPLEEQSALYRKVALEIERAYEACVDQIAKAEPDVIVHLGDVTCGWGHGGMGDPSVRDMAERCAEDLRRLGKPLYCTLGNHDMGRAGKEPEDLPLAADAYEGIFGQLFWAFDAGDMLCIGMCSPLAHYAGSDERILKRKRDQEAFLADTLAAHPRKKWTLFVHDPLAIRYVLPSLRPHMDRCAKVIVGHFHKPAAGKLLRTFASLPVSALVFRDPAFRKAMRKTVVAPSTSPLWYKGYGWLQADIDGPKMRIRRPHADRPEDSEKLPTRSLAWCLSGLEA
jgi:hypothetical protein